MASESAEYLSALHKNIDSYFNFSEVKTLCFELGVDYENIPGDRRSAFIRNLIVSLAKRKRLQELVDRVNEERPFLTIPNVPANFELPSSIAQEDIRQIVQYTVYGDVVHGDKIAGDRIEGNKITVGNITDAEGIAIGRDASATVQKTTAQSQPTSTQQTTTNTSPHVTNVNVQQAADRLNHYLQMATGEYKNIADELGTTVNIILAIAAEDPVNSIHLKLLCLGQEQLAQNLSTDIPGIEKVVADFGTAIQQANS